MVIPCIKGFSEEIRKVFGKYDILTYFKPSNTLRQLLVKPKDPVDKESVVGLVYRIQCEECLASYIGETERSLKTRFNEHRRPSSSNSKVARHIHMEQSDNTVKMDSTSILTTEARWFERGVKEAIYNKAMHQNLKRYCGRYSLPPVWVKS